MTIEMMESILQNNKIHPSCLLDVLHLGISYYVKDHEYIDRIDCENRFILEKLSKKLEELDILMGKISEKK